MPAASAISGYSKYTTSQYPLSASSAADTLRLSPPAAEALGHPARDNASVFQMSHPSEVWRRTGRFIVGGAMPASLLQDWEGGTSGVPGGADKPGIGRLAPSRAWRMLWPVLSPDISVVEAPARACGAAGSEQPYSFLCAAVQVKSGSSCGRSSETRTSAPPAALLACMSMPLSHDGLAH